MLKLKSLSPLFASLALASVISVGDLASNSFLLKSQNLAVAQEMTAQQKIDIINKSKGQVGSGDQLRRFFYGDLLPLAVQPGGAGMVVSLYNKANDVTFSYCATYDVVVAIKKGRVAMFPANEVK
ncbi:hypothetical protein [Floridanema aerugineum]|uniref:Uncharacterized protein n=1 Tax=Floridaenema aerugineum BLCC-F46 TaxID=3153654 RepID=A0ABV4XGW7_9CYAN